MFICTHKQDAKSQVTLKDKLTPSDNLEIYLSYLLQWRYHWLHLISSLLWFSWVRKKHNCNLMKLMLDSPWLCYVATEHVHFIADVNFADIILSTVFRQAMNINFRDQVNRFVNSLQDVWWSMTLNIITDL